MKNRHRSIVILPVVVLAAILSLSVLPAEGRIVEETVHCPSLVGSLLGDAAERNISVYLPPAYDEESDRGYPVLYLLHGYGGTNRLWTGGGYLGGEMDVGPLADALIGAGQLEPMILVMPDTYSEYVGSFFASSSVVGDWEGAIVRDLVDYIDEAYRTLPSAASRGVAGHSMGGYGAMRLAMKYPDVFGAVYAMSPGFMGLVDPENSRNFHNSTWPAALGATSFSSASETSKIQIAYAAVASPNPDKPPLYVDLPFEMDSSGQLHRIDAIWDLWVAQTPLAMLAQYGSSLAGMRGVAIDWGSADYYTHVVADSRAFAAALSDAGIDHMSEEYSGGHGNRIRARMESHVLPFFNEELSHRPASTVVEATIWGRIKIQSP
ncbi:MAG: alpha/beta fold hydrolase [Gemmatimonadetes bacterium]|nr:alpha/beta fold hydrolase [Gemmatimonadota bacterium]MBT6150238.1 alpha/beta fold hydrolase [Gemmatimonadota bacterium]MBT7864713.1 alpha/beta fold hydrolase [Gemmatimonadota bacterium]